MSDLQDLGALLRQSRESYGYTLQEVEAHTRIRAKFIEALENGDLSVLPSEAHARGFLRNYAQFLRVDAEAVIAQFNDAVGGRSTRVTSVTATPRPAPPPPRPSAPNPTMSTAPQRQPPPSPAGSGQSWQESMPASATYLAPEQWTGPSAPRTVPPGSREAQPAPPPREYGLVMRVLRSWWFAAIVLALSAVCLLWVSTSQLSKISLSEVLPTQPPSEFLQGFEQTAQPLNTQEFEATSTPEIEIPSFFDRVIISISAEQRTWARITVDGVIEFEGQVEPDSILQYEGSSSVTVLTGNGAAFDVTYNGVHMGPMGDRGQVVELSYTTTGLITPTPTATLAPTITLVPTPTASATPGS